VITNGNGTDLGVSAVEEDPAGAAVVLDEHVKVRLRELGELGRGNLHGDDLLARREKTREGKKALHYGYGSLHTAKKKKSTSCS